MKKDIHPEYQEVLFIDSSNGVKFICGSTQKTEKKEMHEGKEYPVHYISISSASHPFFTGSKQFIDTEGRVDKFLKRYAKKQEEVKQDLDNSKEEKEEDKKKKKKKGK